MSVNILEKVSINNTNQWLLIRGKTESSPLILQIQAGPGLPMISEAGMIEKGLKLEADYLVAYWDQRGMGKSYDPAVPFNIPLMIEDIKACMTWLLKKFNKKSLTVIGYSIGATFSLYAAKQQPELFSALIAVGIDIDLQTINRYAASFMLKESTRRRNKKWLKLAQELSAKEIDNARIFQQRAKLISNLHGIDSRKNYNQIFLTTLKNLFTCRAYKWKDILGTIKGMDRCQNAILPAMNKINLFNDIQHIAVPIHFAQGLKDGVAPVETTKQFVDFIDCPGKTLTLFENSAHLLHLEEPAKFSALIKQHIV